MSTATIFARGFIRENPVFTLFLGLCPALAVTNVSVNGLAMGAATTFVLVGSNVVVSLIRNIVPSKIRIPSYILVIASFVTVVKLLMNAYVIDLYQEMGVFISLIVVNCMILGRAEGFASKRGVYKSFIDGVGMGLGFTIAITVLSVVRELLGEGKITFSLKYAGEDIGVVYNFTEAMKLMGLEQGGEFAGLLVFILPAGGFIAIGIIIGIFNRLRDKLPPAKDDEEDEEEGEGAEGGGEEGSGAGDIS